MGMIIQVTKTRMLLGKMLDKTTGKARRQQSSRQVAHRTRTSKNPTNRSRNQQSTFQTKQEEDVGHVENKQSNKETDLSLHTEGRTKN